jgi:enoyl-[acyl-carrier protein] reductase I|tara:strand:- start:1068 stop:1865 length:798 start_codon:yes stop_codon:yes gene_type:complete
MKLLNGKNILIVGVANKHSIASGIAESMAENGANIALTYQNERLQKNVEKLGSNWGVETFLACDVSRDEEIENTFEQLSKKWDGLDAVIHAVGFAPRDELDGDFMDVTSREGFSIAHDISSYSFIALAKGAKNMMKGRNGSLLTLSYLGSKMTLPNYNVMGLAKASLEASVRYLAVSAGKDGHRVNAISAGPVKTLAASGVKNFRKMLSYNANRAPLGRNITTKEVGDAATFLSSDMASGISGEILYVDAGFNITAMGSIEEAES